MEFWDRCRDIACEVGGHGRIEGGVEKEKEGWSGRVRGKEGTLEVLCD